jgi:hypothetical protein
MTAGAYFAARLHQVLGSHSATLVAAYFDPGNRFTGKTFTSLMPNHPAFFSSSDILAASLLDVPFLPRAVRALLEQDHRRFNQLLAAVPANVDLWSATDDELEPAYALWAAVNTLDGIGRTRASKLLARKRPRLIPVVDDVLREALDIADRDDTWQLFRSALADQHGSLVDFVEALRPAGLGAQTTTLRLLDAALWMNLSRSKHVAAVGGGPRSADA